MHVPSDDDAIRCPYFREAKGRHIACDSLVPRSRAAVVFASEGARAAWQKSVCERYEPEVVCPYAAALWERQG